MKPSTAFRILPLAVTLAVATACSSTPASDNASASSSPVDVVAATDSVEGTVTAIDTARRRVTVRGPAGNEVQMNVAQSVNYFDKIRVGDTVEIDYVKAVTIDVQPAGSMETGAFEKENRGTVGTTEEPGLAKAKTVTIVAPVLAVDPANNTVTIKGPEGNVVTLDVLDPVRQAYLPKLKVGDLLRAAFTEASAVQIHPKGQ